MYVIVCSDSVTVCNVACQHLTNIVFIISCIIIFLTALQLLLVLVILLGFVNLPALP